MFITVSALDNSEMSIKTNNIVWLRPSFGASEVGSATTIYVASHGKVRSADSVGSIVAKIGDSLDLGHLITPNGLDIYVDAQKVTGVIDADPDNYPPGAKSVLYFGAQKYAVSQTQAAALEILNNA